MTSVAEPTQRLTLAERLAAAGFVAARDEAEELLARSAGDGELLGRLVARRLAGEPLAWVTGQVVFCGLVIAVAPGVYVPRFQSEALARRAAGRLPERGTAVDLCTGSGAIACVLRSARPHARVLATDLDPRAVSCAAANGIDVVQGDLFAPLAPGLAGQVDVVVGVVPYVPTEAMAFLPRDTFTFESETAYDGGPGGTAILRRAVADAASYLRPGGALLLELGGEQADELDGDLKDLGYLDVDVFSDEDGDVRGIEATWAGDPR